MCVCGRTRAQDSQKVRITCSWDWSLPPQEAWLRKPVINIETTSTPTPSHHCIIVRPWTSSTLPSMGMGSSCYGTSSPSKLYCIRSFLSSDPSVASYLYKAKGFSLPLQDISSPSLGLISRCFPPDDSVPSSLLDQNTYTDHIQGLCPFAPRQLSTTFRCQLWYLPSATVSKTGHFSCPVTPIAILINFIVISAFIYLLV